MDDLEVARIRKNSREEIVVRIMEMYGRPMADLRLFTPNAGGDVGPTKKGVAIRPDLIRPLIKALQRAEATARAGGLLP